MTAASATAIRRRPRRRRLAGDDDVDPIAFVPNLLDAVLVLTVAALVALTSIRAQGTATASPDGPPLEGFVDSGVPRAGQGERLGVAYRLADGRLIYVPEGTSAAGR
ncbi:MAG: DUF2149 domain-containing protein [Planctomycetota bacterium]